MEEEEVIQGLIRKDEKIFREFVENHQQRVVNTCFGLLHSIEDAEDVAQDVFIEVFRSVHKFRGDSRLSSWLYRIAVNRSLNFIRDNKKRSRIQSFDQEVKSQKFELNQQFPGNTDNPEEDFENRQRALILHEALNSLPQNQRVALTLSKYEDLGNKEIGEIMNRSVSSVESLIHRAKKNLQKKLYYCYKKKCI
jgi:RNA polymerase sigma-70 factor (ECF subfamily)